MRFTGPLLMALSLSLTAAPPPDCASSARSFLPCELTFNFQPSEGSPYRDDLLRVEFRSPTHKTYLLHAFGVGSTIRVRFSPTESGIWTYHVLSELSRYNDKE